MKSKWSLKFLLPTQSSFLLLPTIFLLSLITFLCPNTALYANHDDFDELLMTEHTTVALCGNLHYRRQNRDCLLASDLKRCLELNHKDPLFDYQEKTSYSCVNSSYSAGVHIIKDQLLISENNHGCLAGNFRKYFDEVVATKEFIELAHKYEESLGSPLKLNYGIDTKDGLFNLQMDTSQIEGSNKKMINISIKRFKEKGHCKKVSAKEVIAKITNEITRLSLKASRKEYDYYGDGQKVNSHVFNASRSNRTHNNIKVNSKAPASSATQTSSNFATSLKQ